MPIDTDKFSSFIESTLREAYAHQRAEYEKAHNARHLYLTADVCDWCRPLTRRERLALWWHYHRPRLHFGPCDEGS